MNVSKHPVPAAHFAEQNRAAIAQLRYELPELMPRIGHRQRLAAGHDAIAAQNLRDFLLAFRIDLHPQACGKRSVESDQAGRLHGSRRGSRVKARRQPRVRVLEAGMQSHA